MLSHIVVDIYNNHNFLPKAKNFTVVKPQLHWRSQLHCIEDTTSL
jgi:hypothetical protein